jgi:hypothetical protein
VKATHLVALVAVVVACSASGVEPNDAPAPDASLDASAHPDVSAPEDANMSKDVSAPQSDAMLEDDAAADASVDADEPGDAMADAEPPDAGGLCPTKCVFPEACCTNPKSTFFGKCYSKTCASCCL